MKEQHNIRISELGKPSGPAEKNDDTTKFQYIKKYLIFFLMGIVCLGCLYMIFSPADKGKDQGTEGLNEVVPMASADALQEDKGKAYEQELIQKKQQEERSALNSLSDYWNSEAQQQQNNLHNNQNLPQLNAQQEAMSSYKNVRSTLGNFYEPDRGETVQLRNEVRALQSQLAAKETRTADPVSAQIALMEKSYQLAAKYLPADNKSLNPESNIRRDTADTESKKSGQPVFAARKQIVSALFREPTDSAFINSIMGNGRFYTVGKRNENLQPANSIKACIQVNQKVTHEGSVRIKLLQDVAIKKMLIPKGITLTGLAKFQGNRLQILVSSIEYNDNIIPVELTAYDTDGQPGIQLPYSPERNALTEVIANMGNSGGTSIALSSSTNQQLTSDLSRSLIQGVSGYFSKKVRMPIVTLKAGLELYLVSKK